MARVGQQIKSFAALDFETADHGRDSACSIGLIRVENNQIVQRVHALIRPPRQSFRFSYVHGIHWCDVEDQLTFGELWETLTPLLQGVEFIAAHNASFDRGVLYACCDTYGIPHPSQPFVCTVQLARQTWRIYPTKPPMCVNTSTLICCITTLSRMQKACAQIVIAAGA